MMGNNILIHIGYPKAASTTLQKHLFHKHSQLFNLGLYPGTNIGIDTEEAHEASLYEKDPYLRTFYDNLIQMDSIEYDYNDTTVLYSKSVRPYITDQERVRDRKIVLSNERFASVFYAHKDNGVKAQRLHAFFPEAKIIIILRNQIEWLRSQYRDRPFDPRCFDTSIPMEFDKWVKMIYWDQSIKQISMLEYDKIIRYYQKLFGKDRVGVFLFEDLVFEKRKFADDISSFMGISANETYNLLKEAHENKGVSNRFNTYRTLKEKYISKSFLHKLDHSRINRTIERFLKEKGDKELTMTEEIRTRLTQKFSKGNLFLKETLALPVDKYNYPGSTDKATS
ncbi:hypothetical protein YH65_02345 [Sulfurovum lithotrophicum]|uniref:Sulfotransferase domain-containing protein n=1 Tax=Sulfurovum lithotrophicum TaxID=206403 RepID=A0A7U4M039_9BACT|nr:sulfotransferase [Sulfurovum lithotrophicum]AKF24362.1 hypothetical protein YH65_02345 [Sulfurovum lithotrophicum]